MNPVIIIPARMASTRLPGKPLADIAGEPMIVKVWRQAVRASLGPVLVAAAEPEIAEAIERAGGRAVLTAPELASGSDRVHAALQLRPGFEMYIYCMTYSGADPVETYNTVIRSVRHPSDPQWVADLATQQAAHDATVAAQAAQAAQHQQQQQQQQQHQPREHH